MKVKVRTMFTDFPTWTFNDIRIIHTGSARIAHVRLGIEDDGDDVDMVVSIDDTSHPIQDNDTLWIDERKE